jgi:DME family drug/metabolite transporter
VVADRRAGGHGRGAVLAVLAASVLFGTTGTIQELGPDAATPLGVGWLRIVVGAVTLWCLARRLPSTRLLLVHRVPFVLGGLGVAIFQPAFFAGTSRCGVALGTMLALGSGPCFAGGLEWACWRRRPTGTWLAATALTVAGGALLVASAGGDARIEVVGIACALGAGLGYAVYALAAKSLIVRGIDSTVSLAWPFTLGAVALAPFAAAEPLGWAVTAAGAVMLLHLGVITVGVAYYLYGRGLRGLDTSTAVMLTLAEPLTAAVAAMVVLDEHLGAVGWLGAAAVLAGLAVAGGVRSPRGHDPPDASSPDQAVPDHAVPDHAVPNHAVPDHAVPNHAVPNHSLRARDGATRGASSGILG